MAWFYLSVAGILEIVWAFFLKQSDGFSKPLPAIITLLAMLGSFWLLSLALRTLPLGTAYMIWTGIGAVGAFILGILALSEPLNLTRLMAALLIVVGIVLMKMSTPASS